MKRVIVLTAVFMMASVLGHAQVVPEEMNYQGTLVETDGTLPTGNYRLEFRVYDALENGGLEWGPQIFDGGVDHDEEVQVIDGNFNVILGTDDSAAFRTIRSAFTGPDRWLEVTVIGSGALAPRQKLLSAPYALKARDSDTLGGVLLIRGGILEYSRDQDKAAYLGKAVVGDIGYNDQAGFSHHDRATTSSYALRQTAAGQTNLNSASGQYLNFNINNTNLLRLSTSDLRYKYNADSYAYFGRARVGYVGHGDAAGFSHIDHDSSSHYALLQRSDGTTYLNAPYGKDVNLRISNSTKMIIKSNGRVGIGTTNPTEELDVAYDARIGRDLTVGDDLFVGDRLTVNSWNFYKYTSAPFANYLMIYYEGSTNLLGMQPNNNSGWITGLHFTKSASSGAKASTPDNEYEALSGVLPKVLQLKPLLSRSIDASKTAGGVASPTLLGDDVEKVFPEMVYNADGAMSAPTADGKSNPDGMTVSGKGVVLAEFSVLSIAAIQELNAKVEALQARVVELEARIGNQ